MVNLEVKKQKYTIRSIMDFFLFASILTVLLTNDSSERTYSIPIGGFNLIERDICFLPLMALLIAFYWPKIYKLINESALAKSVITILGVYFIWTFLGIIRGNSIKNIGFAYRQVIYVLVYFPLTEYLLKNEKGIVKVKNLLLFVFFVTFGLTGILEIIYFGNPGINFRGMFVWIDNTGGSTTVIRVLAAGALYFPFFFLLSLFGFWGKRNRLVLILSLIGLFLTYTRSYWVGTILGLVYIFIYSIRKVNLKKLFNRALVIGFAIFGVILFIPAFFGTIVDRFSSISDSDQAANSYRLIEAATFIDKITKSIFWGYGTGSTVLTMSDFDHSDFIETPFSHDSYLIYLLSFGVIGTLIILFSLIRPLFALKLKFKDREVRQYLLALSACIVCLMGISLTASEISFAGGYFQFGIILALCEYLKRKNLYEEKLSF